MTLSLRIATATAFFAAMIVSAPPILQTITAQTSQPLQGYARLEDAGFSSQRLDEARNFADSIGSAAVVALHNGHVIASWGAVDRPLMAHSVRKSLAGALYGIAVGRGTLKLDASLATLGIDDEPALTANERQATVGDLVAARSGVYHPAAYADSGQDRGRPERGSHPHGTFWFYNNWDFNALESIYEKVTGASIYKAFADQIAAPLGMDDFSATGQLEVLEPSRSRMAAHTMRISARDLARFGQLYLQKGQWNGRQIVPAQWVEQSWTMHSKSGEREGYGYLWWIFEVGALGANYPVLNTQRVLLARGTGGQTIFVIPGVDMVVVHRTDTDHSKSVNGPQIWQLVERLVAARTGAAIASPVLGAVRTLPLANVLPPYVEPRLIPLTSAITARVVGDYGPAGGPATRVFVLDGRLFMAAPGEGEAELFAVSPLSFIVRSQPGIGATFITAPDGTVTGVEIKIGARVLSAPKR